MMELSVKFFEGAPMVPLGELLTLAEDVNTHGYDYPFYGVNKEKQFAPTIASTEGLNKKKYKIISNGQFVFSGMQTGRDGCIRFALFEGDSPVLLSPAYNVLQVKDNNKVLPEYIHLYFLSSERDRLGAFYSDASVRANLELYRFFQMLIPLPPIEVQREYVAAYKSLQQLAGQNEALAKPLQKACSAFMSNIVANYPRVELRSFIRPKDERNSDLKITLSQGVSNLKYFQEPKQTAANSRSDKIVRTGQFAYNRATTRNGEKISIAYREGPDCTVSSAYQIFELNDSNDFLPHFLMLWFRRSEFDRYARYMSKGSAHEFFEFEDMCQVRIPKPPLDVQQAIVSLLKCAEEARSIAREAREQLKKLAPAMVQRAANTPVEV